MDSKEALLNSLINAHSTPDLAEAISGLSRKLDALIKLADDQVHLQRVQLLEAGHILRFFGAEGQAIALSLPDAQDDYLQRVILRGRTFYEAKLLSLIRARGLVTPQSAVCDIGANIGNHTVYFGRMLNAARILAFEPQPMCHATLIDNIALNGLESVATAYNCLLGASSGNGRLARFNARNLGGTAFEVDQSGDVAMFALDEVIEAQDLARLDLIKIDVEGMQSAVLQGAAGVIAARKPAIWVEILDKERSTDGTEAFLAQFGYQSEKLGPNDYLFQA